MDFTSYIEPKLLVLIPVLYILGMFFKSSPVISDKHIPLVLCAASIVLAVLWLLASFEPSGWQSGLQVVFTGFVQGVLCTGAAVLTNQIIKQECERK